MSKNGPFALVALLVVPLWLFIIVSLGTSGAFRAAPGTIPTAMLLAISIPVVAFLLLVQVPAIRARVLAISPVWLAAVHGLRILGAGFLFVYAFGHLPALFALMAGWGDVLVALLAPFVAARLARDPQFLGSAWTWRFHALGMLDFVGAIGSGLVSRMSAELSGGVSTAALGQFPLLIIPGFAVPLWICLHIAAFMQIRHARRSNWSGSHDSSADPSHSGIS